MAVRDKLQRVVKINGNAIDADTCECGFDGKPKPSAGELYLAVHPLGWQGISGDDDLHEEAQIGVTITLRMGFAPSDRFGVAAWLQANTGLDAVARVVITALHKDQLVRIAANTIIGTTSAGYVTPLWFMSGANPQFREAAWFSATVDPDAKDTAPCGVSQELRFGRAQRCQAVLEME